MKKSKGLTKEEIVSRLEKLAEEAEERASYEVPGSGDYCYPAGEAAAFRAAIELLRAK